MVLSFAVMHYEELDFMDRQLAVGVLSVEEHFKNGTDFMACFKSRNPPRRNDSSIQEARNQINPRSEFGRMFAASKRGNSH